jgi:hypothetical protein
MSAKKNVDSLDGRELALLAYVSRYGVEGIFDIGGLQKDYPFAKHLFAAGYEEWEEAFKSLERSGFISIDDASLKTYRLSVGLRSQDVWRVAYAKLIDIDRSLVRDRMLKLIDDIPLHDFIELEQFRRDQNFNDPFLNAFADDQRVGRRDWWSKVCTLAHLYDNVERHQTIAELVSHFIEGVGVSLAAKPDATGFYRKVDTVWKEEDYVVLKASVDHITPWKDNMAIQIILVRWPDISIQRRDRIKGDSLRALLEDATIAHMLLPVGQPDKQDEEMLESTQLIIFTAEDTKDIFTKRRPADRFRELLRQRMDIELLSPYQTTGFVPGTMFYGRNYELRIITAKSETNFAIYGGRQSGKTSVMKQIERVYQTENERPAFFIDCELVCCREDFLAILCNSLGIDPVKSYSELLVAKKNVNPESVLLVDEVDHLFATCDPKEVIGLLRNLNEEHGIRCILAGTTELYKQFRDITSPMYNFADPLLLGPFTLKEAIELARDPMRSLGVFYDKGDSTVKQLINLCGRFPNLIQKMCHELVKKVKACESKTITADMLNEIFEGGAFGEYVIQQFHHNFNIYQKLIVYSVLMVRSMPLKVIVNKVQQYYDLSMTRVEDLLDELVLLFVLEKSEDNYKWAYEQYPHILRRRIRDVDFRIKQAVREINKIEG